MYHSRIDLEKDVLTRYLHPNAFRFMDVETPNPILMCAARTNNKKIYTLRIELSRFPYDVPRVFVTQMLKTKTGEDMNGDSVPMHTGYSENGWTQIGHCYNCNWNPQSSLWSVYYRCLIWLNIYELHLQTGETMDTYLNHQSFPLSETLVGLFDWHPFPHFDGDNSLQNIENVIRIAQNSVRVEGYDMEYDSETARLKPVCKINKPTLNDVTINAGDSSLQNIGNVIRIAQYSEGGTIEYGLEFDSVEGMLKPVHKSDGLVGESVVLCEAYA